MKGKECSYFPSYSKWGVTVTVAITGEVPALTAAKTAMLPLPLAAKPMDGVSLTHVYVVVPVDVPKGDALRTDPVQLRPELPFHRGQKSPVPLPI